MEENDNYERVCMCALNKIFGFKPAIALALIEHLGSAAAVFGMTDEQRRQVLDSRSGFFGQINQAALEWAEKELEGVRSRSCRFIHIGDRDYPALLRDCEDAPIGIYYKSSSEPSEVFSNSNPIAIVGTRDLSPYGREWCGRIVRSLSGSGSRPTIVSGLALGTDVCAHIEALDNSLPTVAVMATGIESVYPWRHCGVAQRIASTPGCALISDYPMGTAPVAINFLRRNRIIAGMSRATILVESKAKGGGMMTANLSSSYGRETYALVGRADDIHSQGCNILIRSKIAEAITDCDSLLDSLNLPHGLPVDSSPESIAARMRQAGLGEDRIGKAAQVLLAIKNCRGISLDEITRLTGLPYREVSSIATRLECDGMINMDMLQRCTIKIN